ncbi:MAG: glycosyltransferase, partial [Sandarakinorhabdus sp.]|nr:glycosyltransferase [Sandarakinorhabdus sp.]
MTGASAAASPTRVMVFLHSFEPGGVERVALRLCGAWATDPRLDVRLVMGRTDGAMQGEAPPGLPLYVIKSGPVPTAAWESIWMMIVLFRHIRRQRPDVLFAAGNSYAVVAVVMKLLLGRRCPPIVLKISNDLGRADLPQPIRWLYHRWLRIQGALIDHFTGLAVPMHAEITQAMGVAGDCVTVIPDPALSARDLTALAAIGAARAVAASRRYVAVGRLAAQKNFGLAVDAFASAAQPGDTLAIIGEGGARRQIEARIKALGVEASVRLPGHGAVMPALAEADVFVLSSDYEALPAVVVEALASGLPVVATDCCVSMCSLVGDFGTVVPRRDAAALATAMAEQALLT